MSPKKQEDRYIYAKGGRKTATALVRLYQKSGPILINGKEYTQYFTDKRRQDAVNLPLKLSNLEGKVSATIKVSGGGLTGQAEAVRHGLARAIVLAKADLKPILKKAGLLTRDARKVERKKYGLKKARRAPQWAKR